MPVLDPQALLDNRVEAIRNYHETTGIKRAQIDVSGGVDSAVILGLLACALGPGCVTAVHSGISTNPEQTARAREAAEAFGVPLIEIDLSTLYDGLITDMLTSIAVAGLPATEVHKRVQHDPAILGSIRSTLRAPIGRGFNRLMGDGIRHGTGNECEDRWCRFYQKGGDGEVDTNPIAMLSKAEVYQLALKLGVPKSVITATPSPDLWGKGDGHNDEDEYATYFGFAAKDYGQTFYGYIDVETGEYTKVGLIERVSRFLDLTVAGFHDTTQGGVLGESWEGRLFTSEATLTTHPDGYTNPPATFTVEGWLETLLADIQQVPCFHDIPSCLIGDLLLAARRIEAKTRHKMNPNCPSLGDRSSLVEAGILTNTLPVLG